jgi:phospholipid/cholesterol/gamma-HCH transport system ATP-binding protein
MIEVEEIHKAFGKQQVLKGCSLEIKAGETMVILGQSGGGKSVLLKIIADLLRQDSGVVRIDGRSRRDYSEEERRRLSLRFGFLFQGAALFDSLTVGQNVTFALRRFTDYPEEKLRQIAEERLNWVGLKDVQDKKPAQLSGGMRKRVGLARAIAVDPVFMLYDEPTTGLDPVTSDAINELILSLQKRLKMTSIVVTHDMTSAFKVGDRLAMLYNGSIVEVSEKETFRSSENPVIQQFIHGRAEGPIQVLW